MLPEIENDWDEAARKDALGTILTIPSLTEDEFWEMGRNEIEEALFWAEPANFDRALDFGCGVGRLTRPLAKHFDRAVGVDISSEMIVLAQGFDSAPTYIYNPRPDLAIFEQARFDFIYSSIVLQHMPPELVMGYVGEFWRLLAPKGRLVFQVPVGPARPNGALSMYGTPRESIEELFGSDLREVQQNDASGPGYTSYRYLVIK